jgi:prefoldin subunit 5
LDRNGSDLLLAKQSLTLENEQLTRRAQLLEQDLSSLRSATTSTSQSIPVCPGHLETIDRLESEARGNKMKIINLEVSCSPVSLLSTSHRLFLSLVALTIISHSFQSSLSESRAMEQTLRSKIQTLNNELSELQSQYQSIQSEYKAKKRELDDSHGLTHPALSFLASLLSLPSPLYFCLSAYLINR